jgi:hypothetical protein
MDPHTGHPPSLHPANPAVMVPRGHPRAGPPPPSLHPANPAVLAPRGPTPCRPPPPPSLHPANPAVLVPRGPTPCGPPPPPSLHSVNPAVLAPRGPTPCGPPPPPSPHPVKLGPTWANPVPAVACVLLDCTQQISMRRGEAHISTAAGSAAVGPTVVAAAGAMPSTKSERATRRQLPFQPQKLSTTFPHFLAAQPRHSVISQTRQPRQKSRGTTSLKWRGYQRPASH